METTKLETGCILRREEDGMTIELPSTHKEKPGWTSLSAAILNGGLFTTSTTMHVSNSKTPSTYDGLNPNPLELAKNISQTKGCVVENTVGLLTAASMQTLRTASRSSDGVIVDVVVTAGISNSRAAGAPADYFLFGDEYDDNIQKKNEETRKMLTPGTINTMVITNAILTPGALVEAFGIAVEAKCAACAELDIGCAKSGKLAQGTGTDCTAFLSSNGGPRRVPHAGKHTLFAEMVGQAVREATHAAIMTNINHCYGNRFLYGLYRAGEKVCGVLKGARPCVPPRPMMPVPWAPMSVIGLGVGLVLIVYALPLSKSARVVMAVVAWDRCLGEPPLSLHPVVIVGRIISGVLRNTTEGVFRNPVVGFVCGLMLLLGMLVISLVSSWLLLAASNSGGDYMVALISSTWPALTNITTITTSFAAWTLEVLLVKTSSSLQLLCTLALQMATFLERKQLPEARSQLAWLCSRDPSKLHSDELAGGTLESLSENLSDGFVAPLFWYVICGGNPLAALLYRVVNTLDSRVGYRGKYEWFGKCSARFDDLLNLVPARITALLLVLATIVVNGWEDAVRGWKVAWGDCVQCDSPNAGWPMGAMAGVLGVRLEKKGQYCLGGRVSGAKLPNSRNIRDGHRVAQLAGGFAAFGAVIFAAAFLD